MLKLSNLELNSGR